MLFNKLDLAINKDFALKNLSIHDVNNQCLINYFYK